MHISEGVLPWPVLLTGGVIAIAGTTVGLKIMDDDRIVGVGIFSSVFFIASLIHVNIGPANVHLILNGLVGLLLGWAAFPAILVALILQALFFQFGGITTLGINTVNMAVPAVLCFYFFGHLIGKNHTITMVAAFATGFLSVFLGTVLLGLSLFFMGKNLWEVSTLVILAHIPVMVIEGVVTVFCVAFLKKVYPALLPGILMYKPVNDSLKTGVIND